VTAGTYSIGGGTITVNGKGQITSITSGVGPDGNLFELAFGVRNLPGIGGGGTRYLWPGSARTTAQTALVSMPTPVAGTLSDICIHQQIPLSSGAQTITYTVMVNGVATAATVTLPVTDGVVSGLTGLAIPVPAKAAIALRATRSASHATLQNVIATIGIQVS
jgi:hypothetical protein